MKVKKYFFIIMLFCLLAFVPKQAVALTSGAAKFDTLYISIPEHDAVFGRPALSYYTLDGRMAYCLQMSVPIVKTQYEAYGYNDPRLAYALVADHGYTGNVAANFQIRQAVICALQPGDPGCVQAAKNLYYAAASYSGGVGAPNISTSIVDFNIEGMQYVSNAISVGRAANNSHYDITLGGFPAGTYITDMNGNPMQTSGITWDSTFQVRIPLEVITYDINSIDMVANGVGNVYNTTAAFRSIGLPSQELLSADASSGTTSNGSRFSLAREIRARGNLKIKKIDEYGEPIANATFQVTNGSMTLTGVTDANGEIYFEDLPAGTFTIIETNVPEGYYNDRNNIDINVITGITVTATKTNKESKGRIRIVKRDAETGGVAQGDATLGGAVYKIFAKEDIYARNGKTLLFANGQEAGTCITGTDGVSNHVDLPVGNYMYKEVTPSTGYNINNEEIDFSIQYENQFVEFMERSFTSEEAVKKNDIEIIKKLQKTDSTPQMNLAGAKFSATLKSDRSKVYYSEPTDESGYCIIQNLPYGTYEIEEIVVPDVALKIDNFDVFVEQDSSERGPYQYTKENVEKEVEEEKVKAAVKPSIALPVYTEEELARIEEEEMEEENLYDDEIDFDEFEEYYDK